MNKKTLVLLAVAFALAWAAPAFAQTDVTYQGYQFGFVDNRPCQDSKFDRAIKRWLGLESQSTQKAAQKQTPAKKQAQPQKKAQPKKQAPAKKQTPAKPQQRQVKPDISPSVTQGGWHSII